MTAAEQLAWAATITPEEWCRRIRDGYRGKPYAFERTNYFRALVELRKVGPTPGPGPTPPANPYTRLAQNVMFTAWDPLAGVGTRDHPLPAHWNLAITADWNVAGNPERHKANAKDAADKARERHIPVAVWANQEQVPTSQISAMVELLEPDYLILQGETSAEWTSALRARPRVIVGNPNAANAQQVKDATELVTKGLLALCFETYTNEGAPWPDASSSAGVPAASFCLGVGWGKTPYQLADYKPHVPAGSWPSISVYLAEKMDEASWSLLP